MFKKVNSDDSEPKKFFKKNENFFLQLLITY